MKRLLFVVALALVPASAAAVPTVVVGSGTIGAYRMEQPRPRAIDVFGPPTRSWTRGSNCQTIWRSLELWIEYSGPCSLPARARRAILEGRIWRTREGLRVGDSIARMKRLYRGARLTRPTAAQVARWGITLQGVEWDLRRARPASSVIIVTANDRVTAFELRPASLRTG